MSDAREEPASGRSNPGKSTDAKQIVADRFAEADLAAGRFINVADGGKGSRDHDTRYSDPREVPGQNYGIYPGDGILSLDIDDYGDGTASEGLDALGELPKTFTTESPHTDGDPGGHRFYHVTGDVVDALEDAFGTANPQPSWGEVRADNQYVVGPGSELDGCDKEWHDCSEPGEGHYTIATDAPIATITAGELVDVLRQDPDLSSSGGHSGAENGPRTGRDAAETDTTAKDYDPVGTPFETLVRRETDIGTYLGAGAKAAGFEDGTGGDDRSQADYRVCRLAIEYGVPETEVRERLVDCSYSKVGAPDAARDYWGRTWSKALQNGEANTKAPAEYRDAGDIGDLFQQACEAWDIDSARVAKETTADGETEIVSVGTVVAGCDDVGAAVLHFDRKADLLSGKERQSVVGHVVFADLQASGEFFQTPGDALYYYHDDPRDLYRIDDAGGRRELAEEYQAFVWDRYNLVAGNFSRNLGKDIKRKARTNADEREVYQFAHYDETAGELYVTDFGDGYYMVGTDGVEWRANGTDVFFLPSDRADPYEYLDASGRPDLPDAIPGEREMWAGTGDPIMRLFGNRVNYDESAAMGPADQRKQLYLHLHTLPFVDILNARPIMAWVGEKGSGKSVIQRSIGQFVYGPDYAESVMPDSKDDFMAKVSNQTLAFFDNYDTDDDGTAWVEDILAAVATGAGIDRRELYTTNDLHQEVPRCWLSLTSRTPEFNRDDVADRTLVFRVERVENGFVGERDYLRQATAYRDLLWSAYLDNLQAIVRNYHETDTGAMSSDHRMADWANFARVIADALDVGDVNDLLATMEAERATFALENEPWARALGEWIDDAPDAAAEFRPASGLLEGLEAFADANDLPWTIRNAAGLGGKLSTYRNELGELYGLEIDDNGDRNRYRFDAAGDDHQPVGLGRF